MLEIRLEGSTEYFQTHLFQEYVYGPLKVIEIPEIRPGPVLPQISKPRWFKAGMDETLTFVRDIAEEMLTRRALVYTVDHSSGARAFASGPIILDEDELAEIQQGRAGAVKRLHRHV